MDCPRCAELERLYSDRIDAYISLVERQSRMFRTGQTQAGRELDDAINEAKAARDEALKLFSEHRGSHFTST